MSSAALSPSSATLEDARHHHAEGNLLAAAEAYRQTLAVDPASQPALLGISLIARQSGQLQPALNMAQAALAAGSESAIAWANLGDSLQPLGHLKAAEAAFRRAIALDPQLSAAHYGLGNIFAIQEDFPQALSSFEAALQLSPHIPEFHFAKAFAHGKLADHAQAIAACRRAVALRPGFASAWLNLGVELIADGRDALADPCYRQAIHSASSQPDLPGATATRISAHLNFGHLARSRRHFPQAEQHYRQALALAGTHVQHRLSEVHVAFAYLHLEQHQFSEAWQSLEMAEAADPAQNARMPNAEIPNARGILLLAEDSAQLSGQGLVQAWVPHISLLRCGNAPNPISLQAAIQSAIEAFHQAETLGHKTAASNRGNALLRLGRCQEALAAHQTAVAADPHHPGVRYNLALTQLRLGDFSQGWPNYEIRWSFREVHPRPRRFAQPRWQGEPLPPPATLLIYSEQGLGDTIQFVRYLDLVAQTIRVRVPHISHLRCGIHLLLEVQPPLTRLLTLYGATLSQSHPGLTVQILSAGDPLPPFTHHCPLLSLPAIFNTTLETVPAHLPYLQSDRKLAALRSRELTPGSHPKIGIAWAGNPNYRADNERSTTLRTFLPLLELRGFQWISLQKGEAASQIATIPAAHRPFDGCSDDQDFSETAALIANLDLVITTDTAVAHLAGALGKPLWLLLPWQSDWRWMQDSPGTPWYPTARIFRQPTPNNWPALIATVAAELQSHSPTRAQH